MVPQRPALNGSKKLVFGAYLQFLFANASMMTENGTFFGTKSAFFGTRNMVLLETFFSVGNQFFCLTTLIQLPMHMTGLKIKKIDLLGIIPVSSVTIVGNRT
jgi:hypothetical protein